MLGSRNIAHVLTGAVAVVALASGAQAQTDPKAAFQARYGELRTAMQAKDAAAVGKILAPDYQMTDIQGGTHDAAEVSQMLQRAPAADPERKTETTVLNATVAGNTATVQQQMMISGKRADPDGAEHSMEVQILSDDSWVKSGDAWVLKSSLQKELTVKKDGEVFFHQAN